MSAQEVHRLTDPQAVAAELGRRLIERRDVKAVQQENGSYRPDGRYVKQPDGKWKCEEYFPFRMPDLIAHLDGSKTFGHYLVSPEGKCRVFCFDIDLTAKGSLRDWDEATGTWIYREIEPRTVWRSDDSPERQDLGRQLRSIAEGLALRTKRLLEIPVAVAYSGSKGCHVYGMTGQMDAVDSRAFAMEVLDSFGCFEPARGDAFWRHRDGYASLEIELFPKQDEIRSDGFGNLLRLPLGINRKSGQPGFFVDMNAPFGVLRADDPMLALTQGSIR
jgi:hypothetical protein